VNLLSYKKVLRPLWGALSPTFNGGRRLLGLYPSYLYPVTKCISHPTSLQWWCSLMRCCLFSNSWLPHTQ